MKLLPANLTSTIIENSEAAKKWMKRNMPAILIGVGDALWAGACAWGIIKSPEMYKKLEEVKKTETSETKMPEKVWNRTKAIAPCMGPVIGMGVGGTTCHILAQKENSKRLATVAAAYAISENRRKTLEEQAKKMLDKKEVEAVESKTREEIVKKTVEENNLKDRPKSLPDGRILTIDLQTGNFGYTTATDVHNAVLSLTERLYVENWIDLNELWYSIDFETRPIGDRIGFTPRTRISVKYDVDATTGIATIDYDWELREEYR